MQCGAVVSGGVLEGVLRWQVDAVLRAAVECAIRLVVRDVRARILQDLLTRVDSLESCVLLLRVWRNVLDLLSVEDGVHAVNEPGFLGIRVVAISCAPITASVRQGWLRLIRSLPDLPIFNLGAFLAPADLPSVVGGLFVSHPPGVSVAALQAGGHQIDRVAAAVRSFAGGVEGNAE